MFLGYLAAFKMFIKEQTVKTEVAAKALFLGELEMATPAIGTAAIRFLLKFYAERCRYTIISLEHF